MLGYAEGCGVRIQPLFRLVTSIRSSLFPIIEIDRPLLGPQLQTKLLGQGLFHGK